MAQNFFSQGPKFNIDVFKQGMNLGMFPRPSQESGFSSGASQTFLDRLRQSGLDPSKLDQNKLMELEFIRGFMPSDSINDQLRMLDAIEQRDIRIGNQRQKFAKESNEQALLYNAISNIGTNLGQIFNPRALAGAGAEIARTANESFRSVPSMNIQGPGYSASQFKYF